MGTPVEDAEAALADYATMQVASGQQRQATAQAETAVLETKGALAPGMLPTEQVPVTPQTFRSGLLRASRQAGHPISPSQISPADPDAEQPYGGGMIDVTPQLPTKTRESLFQSVLKRKEEKPVEPFAKPSLKDYTPESVKKYVETGDMETLVERPEKPSRANALNMQKLRTDFRSDQAVKDYRTIRQQYARMSSALAESQRSPESLVAVDQALITMFNKITDPNSVVRESEYARTTQNQSLINSLVGKVQKVMAGGAGLTGVERRSLVKLAKDFLQDSQGAYRETTAFYRKNAEAMGLDPALVIPEMDEAGAIPTEPPATSTQGLTLKHFTDKYNLDKK